MTNLQQIKIILVLLQTFNLQNNLNYVFAIKDDLSIFLISLDTAKTVAFTSLNALTEYLINGIEIDL